MRRSSALALGLVLVLVAALAMIVLAARTEAQPERAEPAAASAPSYYVDCHAEHEGDGSRARPWTRAADVAAHGPFAPGDRILFARGTSCTGQVAPTGSGTPAAPIVLGAYGDGADPTIAGGGTPDGTGAVELADVHDWTVQDLHITNRPPAGRDGAYRAGLLVLNRAGGRLRDVTVQRLTVDGVESDPGWRDGVDPHEYGGIAVLTRSPDPAAGYDDVRIVGNHVERVGRVGIVSWNDSYPAAFDHEVLIADNTVIWAEGDSILMYGTDGGSIARNTSAYGGALPTCAACRSDPGNTASAGIWPTRAKNVVVAENEVYGEHAQRGDGEGIDIDIETQQVLVERNYVHDNEGGGVLICSASSTTIRANIIQNNGSAAFVFNCTRPSTDVVITNNDIAIGAGSAAAVVRTVTGRGASGILLTNNIVFTPQPAAWDWPGPVAAANNTLLGAQHASGPAGSTTGGPSPLPGIGSGGIGLDTLRGYIPGRDAAQLPSSPIGGPARDFFGRLFTPSSPGRGAAVTDVGQ